MADDVFQRIDELDQETIQRIVDRLEYRARDLTFSAMCDAYLDVLDLANANRVLEIGCGTGVVARAIAARRDFTGELKGTDLTRAFIDAATGFADQEGVGDRVTFDVGDSNQIAEDDNTFDIVIGHTLISHVADPDGLIAEAARVLRPGGRLVLFDGDFASLIPGTGADPEHDSLVMGAALTVACANPTVMREMPRLLRRHRLSVELVQDHVYSEIGHSEFFLGIAEYVTPILSASGVLPNGEADLWLNGLRSANDDGVYFGGCNYYTYFATKPAG
jgi:ubiquinone/menaquinone biosynthesis C-methylase UbiE